MRPAAFITGITGMAVVAGLLLAGEARLGGGTAGEETASAEDTATAPADAREPAAMSDERAEMIARSAEPAAPSAPLPGNSVASKPADMPQEAETAAGQTARPAKAIELVRPMVENAGILSFGGRRLQLAGIVPTPVDRICGPSGRQWPCGMMAKTALRLLLRNRSVSCDLETVEWKETVTTACRLGSEDLGSWLAENGWAEPTAGSPLTSAAEKARQAGKGLYGDDPRRN
ncbi:MULTISPECIES: thermonuclease family protein [Rhizobium]|jgi:endonuclease YncB( thermonuclease family)|uniref:thermonuclease family protein n=1 Tax=Rhizobium TaxID=379 RepID=UPI0003731092|nr:thermonuclease family protein [Rhizobium leguminosarum]ASR08015.1 hypothetical protein CHY08_13425 [Rhizobium leguminosarum bv. viciae]MBY5771241.1 thermonuclease family protein [Rhizobium leguminosarum]MBY5794238.1 thermonuclease family protein [Rhizobium leguminosarum]MBY5823263.1 thermonuclease family protein [Rhizobium leguminosarum]TCA10072.1 thermonuclease family protein [Rhizobium leguminosarum bv. viciae]